MIDLSDFNLNKACRSLRHKLSLACLFVSSELLFNVLIEHTECESRTPPTDSNNKQSQDGRNVGERNLNET
jgi:hypothetical protein